MNEVRNNKIGGFTLVNHEKLNRAIEGHMGRGGRLEGGIGEGASDEAILAEYDRLGGLIRKGKNNVKMGSFYDFPKRKPHDKPKVVFIFKDLEGNSVELEDGAEIPDELKAVQIIEDKKAKKRAEALAAKEAKAAEAKAKKNGDEEVEGDE